MAEKIFREKSLRQIASPEEMDRYIRVTRPSVWIVLAACVALLVGVCLWGVFGHLDDTVEAQAQVSDGQGWALLTQERALEVQPGMEVLLDGEAVGQVSSIRPREQSCEVWMSLEGLADGEYALSILIQSVQPASFLFQ